MLNRRAQFARISRPRVSEQGVHGAGIEFADGFLVLRSEFAQERLREQRDVGRTFTQGREMDFDDAQSEIKILAEFARARQLAEVLVGRC
ncbi:MAG: hypothetical protein JW388_1331 [Nitrospira sp.]|nr:hypothetical protein [Nitrospira sp.]